MFNDSAEGSEIQFRISGSLQWPPRDYMVIMVLKVWILTDALAKLYVFMALTKLTQDSSKKTKFLQDACFSYIQGVISR